MNKVLIALLAGIAAGILIAPAKGSASRAKLVDGFNDLADKLQGKKSNMYQDALNTIGEHIGAVEKHV
ncbi:MAG: YtxH domain-containing protein [Chitinophagaceae bacterium]